MLDWIRNNSPALVVLAVGTAISFVIGLALTGDISEGFAKASRR